MEKEKELMERGVCLAEKLEKEVNPSYRAFYKELGDKIRMMID